LIASLPFTGERFTPEVRGAIWYEHWHRYCAVLDAAAGKRVLDAACGEGYGGGLLASVAVTVTAIDVDADAIAHASRRYREHSNLHYLRASCAALPLPSASIDLIVSFETIEHLVEQDAMLDEFRRVLAEEGALIISSPNKAIYSDESGQSNHFHVRELSRAELAAMLVTRFPVQAWYGQRVSACSLLWADEAAADSGAQLIAMKGPRVEALERPASPMHFVVACGAEGVTLPRLPSLSLFDDGEQSLYRDYEGALLAEKRLSWDELDARKIAQQRLDQAVAVSNEQAAHVSAKKRSRRGSRSSSRSSRSTRASSTVSTRNLRRRAMRIVRRPMNASNCESGSAIGSRPRDGCAGHSHGRAS
jgi:SAM-dependent methyltransferase